jgi:hypothetical protein
MTTVSGFYVVKDPMTLTFFVTSFMPRELSVGQAVLNLPGITGGTRITKIEMTAGNYPSYGNFNGSFDFQTDKAQTITGVTRVSVANIQPPPFFTIPDQYPLYGNYVISNQKVYLYSSTPLPARVAKGWVVKGIPGIGTLIVESARPYPSKNEQFKFFGSLVMFTQILATPLPRTPITGLALTGQAILSPPFVPTGFIPQTVSLTPPPVMVAPPIDDDNFPRNPVDIRHLNEAVPGNMMFEDTNLSEKRKKGFSAGGVLSLDAIGPQEDYISTTKDFAGGPWDPSYPQYTQAVVYQQRVPFPKGTFIRRTEPGVAVIELRPPELGDLFSNMHLQVALPPLQTGNAYTVPIGRALIEKVEFIINDTVVETIYDDWLVARDQIFLDYDEQVGMFNMLNGGSNAAATPSAPLNMLIPLEFFFCRRHSSGNKGRERLRRPYFPVCAMWSQKIYIRFTFRPQNWFTNCPNPVDLIEPTLVIESVRLSDAERLYYRSKPLRFIVPTIKKESTAEYNQGTVRANLTANFPVQLLVWFIRNKSYEIIKNSNFYDVRYLYGYASQYISTSIPLPFPQGPSKYIDAIQTVKITMNNVDILDTFANGSYCSFLQPMDHGLSVPQKNIYMYSFGLNITEYNQGGYIDFSKLNSQTSTISLTFLPELASSITNYSLYLFYYGYSILEFQGGSGRLVYV